MMNQIIAIPLWLLLTLTGVVMMWTLLIGGLCVNAGYRLARGRPPVEPLRDMLKTTAGSAPNGTKPEPKNADPNLRLNA